MNTILLLEDDGVLRKQLTSVLGAKYQVHDSGRMDEGFALIQKHLYDVVVTDRLLIDGDSLALIEYVREMSPTTKVICISKLSKSNERIEGLYSGADDYLPKPLCVQELVLKVERILELERKPQREAISFGPCAFFPETGRLQTPDRTIQLRKKEAAIFYTLLRHRNYTVSRQTILAEGWPEETAPLQTSLDVYMRRLRIQLGEYAYLLQTSRGYGYKLVSPVEV
ncbi:MAG: response regulator transcription factor [Pseudomonadales bacterium]|nr:response regulator transcription factor [Candidatus Woesebacteria bacterium]MCB9802255.1 response regulator transcription factor [Pseudomonadales bacterium]